MERQKYTHKECINKLLYNNPPRQPYQTNGRYSHLPYNGGPKNTPIPQRKGKIRGLKGGPSLKKILKATKREKSIVNLLIKDGIIRKSFSSRCRVSRFKKGTSLIPRWKKTVKKNNNENIDRSEWILSKDN